MEEHTKGHPSFEADEIPDAQFWTLSRIAQMGLLEYLSRFLLHGMVVGALTLLAVLSRTTGFPMAFVPTPMVETASDSVAALAVATPVPGAETGGDQTVTLETLPPFPTDDSHNLGIRRRLLLETDLPQLQRTEPITYVVRRGDTLASIAEKFGLKVETIFWSNVEALDRDPHTLRPGLELIIPPEDGILYEWEEGDTLFSIAEKFGVDPEDIVEYPTNNLDPSLLIDEEASKDIEPGTLLFIPGAQLDSIDWTVPRFIREKLAYSPLSGPGECGPIGYGPIGTYTFIWPTTSRWITTYYSVVHPALDIAGAMGLPIYAADHGVVVYSGWHYGGYGYVVVIDHGNGWQTLYAHMSVIFAGCGQEVYQGQIIGSMGSTGMSTGPHVHFELMHPTWGKVNPLQFLPEP